MGCCASQTPSKDKQQDSLFLKILILGSGGSGKSTVFNHLQYIHRGSFTQRVLREMKTRMYEQVIETIQRLADSCGYYYDENSEKYSEMKVENNEMKEQIDYILNYGGSKENLTQYFVDCLINVWNYKPIQEMFKLYNEICVPLSTKYYMNKFDVLCKDDYIPNKMDVLSVRYRTTGMKEMIVDINGTTWKICEVGGQRSERKYVIYLYSILYTVCVLYTMLCILYGYCMLYSVFNRIYTIAYMNVC